MLKNETSIILQRIKAYYPKFYYDDYTTSNWYMELKNYEPTKIIEALREYANNNQEPPGVMQLMAIANRMKEETTLDYETFCNYCGRFLDCSEQTKHEDRCRSIRYIERKYKQLWGKEIDKKALWDLSDDDFNEKYFLFLQKLYNSNALNKDEMFYIGKYFETFNKERENNGRTNEI